jgi:putative CocE/NonD family hydrolase
MKMRKEKLIISLVVLALIVSFVIGTIPAVTLSAHEETPIWWEEYLTMRDGVRLNTRIFLPDPSVWGSGPYPAIAQRTPYGIGKPGVPPTTWPTEPLHGYAYVYQDTRGRYYSQGVDRLFYDDGPDGYDTIEWVAQQSWCNGKVGMSGASALGITTYLAAGERPPHLVAALSYVASANLYNDLIYDGGASRFADAFMWVLAQIGSLSDDHLAKVVPPSQWEHIPEYQADCSGILADMTSHMGISFPKRPIDSEWFMHLPLKGFNPNFSVLQPFVDEVLSHPSEDDFRDHLNVLDTIDIPILHVGGWYDFFAKCTVDVFVALQNRGNQKLLMARGTHGNLGGLPPSDPFGWYYGWFDYWLKGVDTGIMDEPSVGYYCLGANEWRWADQWPPGGIQYTDYYLHDGGVLSTGPCAVGETPESYLYDPMNPVLTWGGRNLDLPAGPKDQRPAEAGRNDILIYTTDVLTKDVEIAGPIKVGLSASSNCTDTDFTAKVIDVYPNGSAMLVIDNIIRARYRESMRDPVLMEPGHIYEFNITLGDISQVFKAGHKIQVDISSSNFPEYDRNLNSGGSLYTETKEDIKIANNTIYHDAEHPSYITLPVMRAPVQAPVGGIYIPVNKLQLLAPYIGLTILLTAAVITAGYVKKRKRNTEINS